MEKILVFLALTTTAPIINAGDCVKDGQKISISGVGITKKLEMADGSLRKVEILNLNNPICAIEEDAESGLPRRVRVTQVQIIGNHSTEGDNVVLTGIISTGNITQYYAVSTAIRVISGKKLPRPQSIVAPIEPGAALYSSTPQDIALTDELVKAVRGAHFVCDSVSATIPSPVKPVYLLACNHSRYRYFIQNLDGSWYVKPQE